MFGYTKKEESKKNQKVTYKQKYLKLRDKYNSIAKSINEIVSNSQVVLQEHSVLNFLIYAIAVQHGHRLEISPETIKISQSMQNDYELEIIEEKGAMVCQIKRKVK